MCEKNNSWRKTIEKKIPDIAEHFVAAVIGVPEVTKSYFGTTKFITTKITDFFDERFQTFLDSPYRGGWGDDDAIPFVLVCDHCVLSSYEYDGAVQLICLWTDMDKYREGKILWHAGEQQT